LKLTFGGPQAAGGVGGATWANVEAANSNVTRAIFMTSLLSSFSTLFASLPFSSRLASLIPSSFPLDAGAERPVISFLLQLSPLNPEIED